MQHGAACAPTQNGMLLSLMLLALWLVCPEAPQRVKARANCSDAATSVKMKNTIVFITYLVCNVWRQQFLHWVLKTQLMTRELLNIVEVFFKKTMEIIGCLFTEIDGSKYFLGTFYIGHSLNNSPMNCEV